MKTWAKLLNTFCTSGKLELELIYKVQMQCYEDAKLMKLFPEIVRSLYDQDVLAEDTILHWFRRGTNPKGRYDSSSFCMFCFHLSQILFFIFKNPIFIIIVVGNMLQANFCEGSGAIRELVGGGRRGGLEKQQQQPMAWMQSALLCFLVVYLISEI